MDKMSGKKPTFTAVADLVRIHIRGVPHPEGFPYIPNDHGVVKELLRDQLSGELPSAFRTELVGGGSYVALFHADDAVKITEWLEQRCNKVEEHPK